MRAPFQAGDFPAPVKYGYSSVGVVEQGPQGLRGRTVFCLYPHQTRYVVPAAAVHVLPDGVPPRARGSCRESRDRGERVWDAAPRIGDRVAVVGAGMRGQPGAPGSRRAAAAATVQLIDIDARKARRGRAVSASRSKRPEGAGDADVVVHASGVEPGLRQRLRSRASKQRCSSSAGTASARRGLPLGEAFHSRRLASSLAGRHDRPGAAQPLDTAAAPGARARVAARPRSTR